MDIEEQQLHSLDQVELVADQKNLGKGKLLLTSQYVLQQTCGLKYKIKSIAE